MDIGILIMAAIVIAIVGICFLVEVLDTKSLTGKIPKLTLVIGILCLTISVLSFYAVSQIKVRGKVTTTQERVELTSLGGEYCRRSGKYGSMEVYRRNSDEIEIYKPPMGRARIHQTENGDAYYVWTYNVYRWLFIKKTDAVLDLYLPE